MMIYFIYLAAGNSSRFGDENKLLHDFNGKSIFKHGMDTLHTVSLNQDNINVIVVTKYCEIADYANTKNFYTVFQKEMPDEISYTIKQGISAIDNLSQDDFLIFLVADQPLVSTETIEAFIAHAKGDLLTACAYYQDTKGNPAMFSGKLYNELVALSGDIGGKAIFKRYPPIKIQVQNENELMDIDDAQCLDKLQTNFIKG